MDAGEEFTRTIIHLPGTRLTPEVLLHRTLTKCARIKAVAVVIQWDDDTYDFDWSQQKINELCMAAILFHAEVTAVAKGDASA